MIAIVIWLAAIATANLTTAQFGPEWSIVNAFLLIGLDLSLRDRIHDRFNGSVLVMAGLVAGGGLISYLINVDAARVALASTVAFAAAVTVDWIVYHFLRDQEFLVRANGSNIPAAVVDSLIFPTIAFGSLLPFIVVAQLAAKIGGGAVWALVIKLARSRHEVPAYDPAVG